MPRQMQNIFRAGGGLMTIDWVVLAAATIGLAISAVASLDVGAGRDDGRGFDADRGTPETHAGLAERVTTAQALRPR